MEKVTICATEKGGFTSFVKENDQIKKDQVLGCISVYADITSIQSTVDGQISKIYLHPEMGGVVEKDAVLYEILPEVRLNV